MRQVRWIVVGVITVVLTAAAPVAEPPRPVCEAIAFAPQGEKVKWKHKRTRLFTVKGKEPNHRGQDVVVQAGREQILIAKFAYGRIDKDLKDELVEVYVQREPPCGAWEMLGETRTSKDGEYEELYGLKDDGGRIFFTIPQEKRLPVGRYPIRMLVKGDHSSAAFELFVVAPGTEIVVFDIDGTLTVGDSEVSKEYFARLASLDYAPKMYAGADDVVSTWAGKGYLPVYMTGRPDNLRAVSRDWLMARGMPPGVLHCTDTLQQALPTSKGVGLYKSEFLGRLTREGLVIAAAYGNAATDIEAYAAAGIDKGRTFIIGPNAGTKETQAVKSYTEHLERAVVMPAATKPFPALPAW
jgi:phosphatidate phosphatase PAH1